MKELMDFDKQLRKEAEDTYQKKHDLRKKIEEEKAEIGQKYWIEAEKEVKKKKQEIDEEIQKSTAFNQQDLERRKELLQEKYNENKEKWIKQIVSQSCQ